MAISVADNFQYLGTKPLDARLKFASVSDMASTAAASLYDGCFAYVTATKKYYSYDSTNDVDPTLGKWREFTSGSGSADVVSGYYKESDHLFYEESTYTTAITGKANVIYISLDTDKTYRFNGSFFVRLDYEEGQIVQIDTLPTASADNLGKIYEYTGATGTYTNGVFYQCVFDGTDYSWAVVDVVDTLSTSDVTDVKNAFNVSPSQYGSSGIVIDLRGNEYPVGVVIDTQGNEKTLWEKTYTGTVSNENSIVYNPVGANVETFVDVKGVLNNSIPIFGVTNDNVTAGVSFFLNDNTTQSNKNTFGVYSKPETQQAWVGLPYRLTLQYTKTT